MEKRLVLCIGNNNYKRINPLTCAINDADQMGKALRRLGFETTVEHDLNRADLISSNTVVLCPNCHTRMHILDRQEDIDKLHCIAQGCNE